MKHLYTVQFHCDSLFLQDDDTDELFDDNLEVEIKEEVEELPEIPETISYHVESTDDTKDGIREPKPSTSYISVTPLHNVIQNMDKAITPNSKLSDMDEFHLFGMNVASQLRTMPLRDALQSEVEIQAILAQKRSGMLE